MAQSKSVVDIAIEHIDAQIADLNRAKEILTMAAGNVNAIEPAPKKRGRKRKAGMPSAEEPSL